MRRYRYVFLNLIITIFISLCSIGCCGCLKKFLNSKCNNTSTKEENEIKGENHSEIKGKENKEKDKEEDLLIEKRKKYFEGVETIKEQYDKCNKTQDLTKYKIDNDEFKNNNNLKKIFEEVNKVVNEEDRIFIQSDTEGKVFNITSALQIANIIDTKNPIIVYYNFYNGNFEKNESENSIKLKLFEVNKNFNGTYIHLGDIVDRCNGDYQCLKSLLLILYIKQKLGNKVKLICGNHELMYINCQPACDCCYHNPWGDGDDKRIHFITRLICLTAISKGQIQYLDQIKIGKINYILTHKVLYNKDNKKDVEQIKYFLQNKMNVKTDLKNYGIYDLIKVVNDNFKKYFCDFFYNYDKKNKTKNSGIIEYTYPFDHLYTESNPKKEEHIVFGNRIKYVGYDNCLKNQICGHDHHEIGECYIEQMNILFVDNYSFVLETYKQAGHQKPMVNIHFFDKNEELSKHKAFNIINDEGKLEIKIVDNFC